jgi:hypothetical protein
MVEWARRLLEDQILRLSELRNASPRDAGFKLWRQTTLTVIQRIWPGDLIRCERFRRIPFTPASTKASRAAQKQHYERGCVEAGQYLRMLITEIEANGLSTRAGGAPIGPARLPADLANRAAEEESAARVDPRDMYEPSPLEKIVPSFGNPDSQDAAEEAVDAEPFEAAPPPEPPRAVAPPTPPAPPPPAAPPRPTPPAPRPAAPPPPPKEDRRALKDMLGFGDLRSPTPAEPAEPPAAAPAKPAFKPPPHPEDFAPAIPPLAFSPQDIEDFPIESEQEDAGEMIEAEEAPPPASTTDPGRDLSIEFLRRSPAAGAAAKAAQAPPRAPTAPQSPTAPKPTPAAPPAPAKPVAPPSVAAPSAAAAHGTSASTSVPAHSPAATAFATLAGEVARLGVPEGQRAAARAALTDMAQRLASGTLKWDSVCQVLTMAAAYPELARRAIPLIVPFLDVE